MTSETPDAVGNVETEYLEINSKGAWPILFQHIRNESANNDYTCNESKKPENRHLNRYRDVAPYDHSRIVLKKGSSDYINANLVSVEGANRRYILSQGPLSNTAGHFWQMVWEQETQAILMLNKVIENKQIKCHQYWPTEDQTNQLMIFRDVNLEVEYVSKKNSTDYTTRTLRLTDMDTKESREILHFHYTTWPDFGVPQSPTSFLRFLVDVRSSGALDQNVGPPIVHCSAGIGRSGTFCLVDSCLVMIEKNGLNSVNVRDVLLEMRCSRMGLIQTPDQLRFSYAAIIEGHRELPTITVNGDNNLEINENHYDVVNNTNNSSSSSSLSSEDEEDEDDDDDGDEAPPLPPPRGDSLTRRMLSNSTSSPVTENENGIGPPNKPLPMEPPTLNRNNHNDNNIESVNGTIDNSKNSLTTTSSPSSPDSQNGIRRRNPEKLKKQVQDIKRKLKEAEDWQELKRSLFKPVTIGIGTMIIGGGVIALCSYLYLRG
ncbi:hypothetical protein HCN44_001218 [Aphidius gifuensis]|uniref:protein-tyrosine-phosphatase n=1 Tax=Aphidius gifuensis TaxID=684658 RepID=A0A834XNV6_APHGI|nr:tyrosine-protein phosphatase non-receptor type 2 isoform X2 [Aphidius gifuensis]XP_044014799.1 tyrosine-protein phosphatase non-receptor type 2 isoform X2 [Aphidius gifuensis]KAF7988645.1 hypothetical protein HCN44_001218 [Aphidius gifuensis]